MPRLFLLVSLLFLLSVDALAERTTTQLTPEHLPKQPFEFKVEVVGKSGEGSESFFRVTVRREAKSLSEDARVRSTLRIHDGKTRIADCPVEAQIKGDKRIYSFWINKKYFKHSTFEFGESYGKEEIEGRYYWFVLENFVN